MTKGNRRRRRPTQAVYDSMGGWYDLMAAWSEAPIERQALIMLSARRGEDIVEVGPGTGRALLSLAEVVGASGRVWGVDLSTGMLRRSRRRLAREGLGRRVALVCGDAAHLALRSSSVDAALAVFAVEVLDRAGTARALAECRRVLRPGGRLVVAAMAEGQRRHPMVRLYHWARESFPEWVNCRPIHARALLTGAGFHIVDAVATSVWGLPVEIVLATNPVPR